MERVSNYFNQNSKKCAKYKCQDCREIFTRRADAKSLCFCIKCSKKKAGKKISATKIAQSKLKPKVFCKIDGCDREAMYKKDKLCQMHYFRFMRNKTFDKIQNRKYRIENPAGYQKIYEPKHTLSDKDGYVYEHRFVYYNSEQQASKCCICGLDINWKTLHIDHIDDNVRNNNISNLRPTCRNCNTTKDRKASSMSKHFIEINGTKKSIAEWARDQSVKVSYHTIIKRLKNGYSERDALFAERKTHKRVNTKKTELKYMAQ